MRKSFLLAVLAAFAALAVGAASAQAAVRDGDTGQPCPNVVVDGNDVSGGCVIEDFSGTLELWSGSTPVDDCDVSFDLRIEADADAWAVDQSVSCNVSRRACLDAQSQLIPWPSPMDGPPKSMSLCIQNSIEPPGGTEYWQNVEYEVNWTENFEILGLYQINTDQVVRNLEVINTEEYDEVFIAP